MIGTGDDIRPNDAPLEQGSYCIVVFKNRVYVARGETCMSISLTSSDITLTVLEIYTRSGGKSATHGWVAGEDRVGRISYLAIQVFEYLVYRQFSATPSSMTRYRLPLFGHISIDCVLCRLPGKHELSADRETLTIDLASLPLFKLMHSEGIRARLLAATNTLTKGRRKAAKRTKKPAPSRGTAPAEPNDSANETDEDE